MIAHPGIVLAVAATVIYNLGFILEKRALARLPAIDAHHVGQLVRTLFTAPAWLAGFALICGGLVLQVLVLSLEPLSVAQPLQACGVVVTIVFSRLVLHERLGRTELACIGVIAVAVLLLGLSVGRGAGAGRPRGRNRHRGGRGSRLPGGPGHLRLGPPGVQPPAPLPGQRHQLRPVRRADVRGRRTRPQGPVGRDLHATGPRRTHRPRLWRSTSWRPGPVAVPPHPGGGFLVAAVLSPYLYAVLACSAAGMFLFQTALQRSPASVILPMSNIISTGYLVVIGSWLFHERLPAGLDPLAMRLAGGVAAVAVPVILTVATERTASHRRPGHQRHDRHRPVPSPSTERPLP